MPRPADFTAQMLQFCDEEMERYKTSGGPYSIPPALLDIPHLREAWYCGKWLDDKLTAAGCARELIRMICFANGQKCAMAKDPWVNTLQTLEDYLTGKTPDVPGAELAKRLLKGKQ